MKVLIPFALLLALSSCSTMSRAAKAICDAQGELSSTIEQSLSWAGPPGVIVTRIVNMVLEVGCKAVEIVMRAPEDLATDVGLMGGEKDEAPAPQSDPSGGQ